METIGDSELFLKCRLCGIFGHHKREVLEENPSASCNNRNALSQQIFRCVGVQVERDDETTKICDNCVVKIADILHFRGICATTHASIKKSKRSHSGLNESCAVDINFLNLTQAPRNSGNPAGVNRFTLSGPSSAFMSLIRDDTALEMDEVNTEPEVICATQVSQAEVFRSIGTTATVSKRDNVEMESIGFDTEKRKKMRRECTAGGHHEVMDSMNGGGGEWAANLKLGQINNWSDISRTSDGDSIEGSDVAGNHSERGANIDGTSISLLSEDDLALEIEELNGNILTVDKRTHHCTTKNKRRVEPKAVKGAKRFVVKCLSRWRCEENFESWDAMKYHVTTYHAKGAKKTSSCHLCKKTYARRSSLLSHLNEMHVGYKRFKCPFPMCSMAFTRKYLTKIHMNTVHAKKNVFKCSKCPMIFYRKCLLNNHLGSEHGEGIIFHCYLCKKISTTKFGLQQHMNALHTCQIRFQCLVRSCSKVFTQKSNLKRHTNAVHTKESVFKCTKCPLKFYSQGGLRVHSANMHC